MPLRPGCQGAHRVGCGGRVPQGPPGTAQGLPCPQTQPVPNPVAYFLHRSPWWFHRFETLSNHFLELVVPFFIFLGRRMCIVHGALQVLFQVSSHAHGEPELPHPICRACEGGPSGAPLPRGPCPHLPAPRRGGRVPSCPRRELRGAGAGGDPHQAGACGLVGCLLWLLLPSSLVSCLLEVLCFLFWVFLVMRG